MLHYCDYLQVNMISLLAKYDSIYFVLSLGNINTWFLLPVNFLLENKTILLMLENILALADFLVKRLVIFKH